MRAHWSADNAGRFTASELPGAVTTPRRENGGDDVVTTFRRAVHIDDHGRVLASIVAARDHKRRAAATVRVRCIDGRYRWAEWQVWPDGDGITGEIVLRDLDLPRVIAGMVGMAYN